MLKDTVQVGAEEVQVHCHNKRLVTIGSHAASLLSSWPTRAGLAGILFLLLFCFVGPLIYHTNQDNPNLLLVNEAPSSAHLLGTSDLGFDIVGRLMVGGRSSLEIGLAVGLIATTVGALWGAVAGILGGLGDAILMRVVDLLLAVPALFIFIYLATIFRPNVIMLVLVISALSWLSPARLARGETLTIRELEYVDSAYGAGAQASFVVRHHVLRNILGTMVVNASFQVADAVLVLASLSFLGFGLPEPAASWGGMLSNGVEYLSAGYWWQIYPAGLMIVITVVSFSLLGDALREYLDTRIRRV